MMNRNLSVYSVNDILDTLNECQGRDWHMDDALYFVSDLTGLSVDAIWQMMEDRKGESMKKIEIFFSDLKPDTQERLLQAAKIVDPKADWENTPLVTIDVKKDANKEE